MSLSWRFRRYVGIVGTAGLAAWVSSTPAIAQASSASYRLQPMTINGGGAPATAPNSRLNASIGQELAVGASSSPHFIVQSGFWSFVGSSVVPVVLLASRNIAQSTQVDLTWSGNNASYDIYRNTGCASVFSSVLASTSNRFYFDTTAPSLVQLVCYNVLALAPGPVPPPDLPAP
jgi:hypothetical protein